MNSMLEKLKKLKKPEGEMSSEYKDGKMAAIKSLKELAMGSMKDMLDGHMKGMKKVTVASPTDEGLKEGLDKAEDVLESKDGAGSEEESAEAEDMLAGMDKEELMALLEAAKKKLAAEE